MNYCLGTTEYNVNKIKSICNVRIKCLLYNILWYNKMYTRDFSNDSNYISIGYY